MPEMKSFSTPTPAPPTSQTKTTRPESIQFALGIKRSTETQKAGVKTPHVVGAARSETRFLAHEKTHKNPRRKNYSEGASRP
jgi:hypothetical protein